jgi:hypothetical protein
MQQGQAVQGASNTVAGLMSTYAQMQQSQQNNNQNYNNVPNGGNVKGYTYGANGYTPITS